MRVCARIFFGVGMEVVVGVVVGSDFGSADFGDFLVHRAHGDGCAGG